MSFKHKVYRLSINLVIFLRRVTFSTSHSPIDCEKDFSFNFQRDKIGQSDNKMQYDLYRILIYCIVNIIIN